MAITFPSNPADGDTFTWGGVRYTFDSTPGAWVGAGGSDPVILYGTTFPNNGIEGELFYYEGSTSGDPARLYVYNGGVWVDAAPAADAPPIDDDSVSEVKLQVSNSPVDGYMLTAQSGNTGGLTWAAAFDGAYSSLTGTPTTISGYGITDAFDGAFSSLTGTPTTLAGYGITDGGGGGFSGSWTSATTSAGTNATTRTPDFTLNPGGICFVSEKGTTEGSVGVEANGVGQNYAYINTTTGNVTVRGRCTNGGSGAHKSIIFYAFNP